MIIACLVSLRLTEAVFAPLARKHQRQPPGVEHARLGVERFAEELGAHERMVVVDFGDDLHHVWAVGRHQAAHVFGGEEKDALVAVLLLGLQGSAALAPTTLACVSPEKNFGQALPIVYM